MQIAITISIVGLFVGMVLFSCLYLGFRSGLRLGMNAAKGIVPAKIEPVKHDMQSVKQQPKDTFIDSLLKGHANMMAFDGEVKEDK